MKILVACHLPDFALEELRALSSELSYRPEIRPEELREAIRGVGILVVDGRRVSPEVLARSDTLQMIVRAGPGRGDVALAEASAQGIFITHCPDQHAQAVAELAFGLVLALDRRIVENTLALRAGRWNRAEFGVGRGLAGRTLGLLGYGTIGREVAQRGRAFGMRVLVCCPTPGADEGEPATVRFCNWPREVARESDVVVVVAGASEAESRVLVDADFLESMREGALLVHVGQAGTVDENAVARIAPVRNLRVAMDVFTSEPIGDATRIRNKLWESPNVIGTQHIGPLTDQARHATAAEVVRVVRTFLVSGEVLHCLNLLEHSPATWQLMLRVRDAVGVMASILEAIRADGVNAEEVSSRVFLGARAAWCAISLDERPSNEALNAIRALKDVLYLELRAVV